MGRVLCMCLGADEYLIVCLGVLTCSCACVHARLCLSVSTHVQSSWPPLHSTCVLCMTLECDGNRRASCVVTVFVIFETRRKEHVLL